MRFSQKSALTGIIFIIVLSATFSLTSRPIRSLLGMFKGWRLPYDAEVEYLESTGTQWIDTGVVPKNSTGFQVSCRCLGTTSLANYRLIGVQDGSIRCLFSVQAFGTDNTFFGWNTAINQLGLYYDVDVDASLNYLNNRYAILNGQTKANNLSTLGVITRPMYLFGNNSANGNIPDNFSERVYLARISEDSTLVRDFIPVRFTNEKDEPEGAMYDRVSGELFRNQGTGAFVIGPDL